MSFQDDPNTIRWRLHLRSPIEKVYRALSTDAGRASFWAESAVEGDGVIHFIFPNGATWDAQVLQAVPPLIFKLRYYGNSITEFSLEPTNAGSTDLTLTDSGVPPEDRVEVVAGWVSVLMSLKAATDFGIDLRSHNVEQNWDNGFVDN